MTENSRRLELGLDTFGDVTVDPNGSLVPQPRVIREVIEEAVRADQLGLNFFSVGEHHRADLAISAPEVVLAAIATRTERIHLGSAVTILSTDDPVRVYERFATLDAISGGRAEVIMGRGSFIESFALFGYQLEDYDVLFDEKLQLWAELIKEGPVSWSGQTRSPLTGQRVYPTTESGTVRTWVGVGGTPQSVIRAARYGFPLVIAIIGGQPLRFAPLIELYRRALNEYRQAEQPVAAHSPGHIADSDEQAREELWPHYQAFYTKIGRERGWPPVTRAQFEAVAAPDGALFVGAPETVARKIVMVARGLGLARFDLKYSMGTLPHEQMMRSIQLFGTKVASMVRDELAKSPGVDVAASA